MGKQMTPEQKTRAIALSKVLNVTIATDKDGKSRARKVIRPRQNYKFLGYIPLVIQGAVGTPFEGFKMFLNVEAKLLKNGFYLDLPQEKGKNNRWYSDFSFGSAETRSVITFRVANMPEIAAWIEEGAKAQFTPEGTVTADHADVAPEVSDEEVNPYEESLAG